MVWIVFGLALLISLAALAYVVWPLFRPGPTTLVVEDDRLVDLLARKDATMVAIKELEFDFRVGKLDEEDYRRLDERLRSQAIAYLKQIEALTPAAAGLDDTLETEIARRRTVQKRPPVAQGADIEADLEAEIKRRRKVAAPVKGSTVTAQPASHTRYCTNCGTAVAPNHKFCANCGAVLDTAVASSQESGLAS